MTHLELDGKPSQGYCYLWFFKKDVWTNVADRLGAWPEPDDVARCGPEAYVRGCVMKPGGLAHITEFGSVSFDKVVDKGAKFIGGTVVYRRPLLRPMTGLVLQFLAICIATALCDWNNWLWLMLVISIPLAIRMMVFHTGLSTDVILPATHQWEVRTRAGQIPAELDCPGILFPVAGVLPYPGVPKPTRCPTNVPDSTKVLLRDRYSSSIAQGDQMKWHAVNGTVRTVMARETVKANSGVIFNLGGTNYTIGVESINFPGNRGPWEASRMRDQAGTHHSVAPLGKTNMVYGRFLRDGRKIVIPPFHMDLRGGTMVLIQQGYEVSIFDLLAYAAVNSIRDVYVTLCFTPAMVAHSDGASANMAMNWSTDNGRKRMKMWFSNHSDIVYEFETGMLYEHLALNTVQVLDDCYYQSIVDDCFADQVRIKWTLVEGETGLEDSERTYSQHVDAADAVHPTLEVSHFSSNVMELNITHKPVSNSFMRSVPTRGIDDQKYAASQQHASLLGVQMTRVRRVYTHLSLADYTSFVGGNLLTNQVSMDLLEPWVKAGQAWVIVEIWNAILDRILGLLSFPLAWLMSCDVEDLRPDARRIGALSGVLVSRLKRYLHSDAPNWTVHLLDHVHPYVVTPDDWTARPNDPDNWVWTPDDSDDDDSDGGGGGDDPPPPPTGPPTYPMIESSIGSMLQSQLERIRPVRQIIAFRGTFVRLATGGGSMQACNLARGLRNVSCSRILNATVDYRDVVNVSRTTPLILISPSTQQYLQLQCESANGNPMVLACWPDGDEGIVWRRLHYPNSGHIPRMVRGLDAVDAEEIGNWLPIRSAQPWVSNRGALPAHEQFGNVTGGDDRDYAMVMAWNNANSAADYIGRVTQVDNIVIPDE